MEKTLDVESITDLIESAEYKAKIRIALLALSIRNRDRINQVGNWKGNWLK